MTDIVLQLPSSAPLPDCQAWTTSIPRRVSKAGHLLPLLVTTGDRLYVVRDNELQGFARVVAVEEQHEAARRPLVACRDWTPCQLRAKVRRMRQRWAYRWWDRSSEIIAANHLHHAS